MYGAALVLLRVGERRTLAQWTLIDVVAAVALGLSWGARPSQRPRATPPGRWPSPRSWSRTGRRACCASPPSSASSPTTASGSWWQKGSCAEAGCGGAA